jgi:hypothetical protein
LTCASQEHVDSEHHVQQYNDQEAQSLKNQDDAASPDARTVSGDATSLGSGSGAESRSQVALSGMEKMSLNNKEK